MLLEARWLEAVRRADARAAAGAIITARLLAGKDVPVGSFFPSLDGLRQEQSPEEQLELVEMLNAAFGGTDQRPKPQH